MPKRIENLEATLKVIIGLYEQNLDALKTELRLRKEGKVRGSTRQIDRVLADMQDVDCGTTAKRGTMRKTKIDDALTIALEHLRPPPDETLPQWIERAVRLPEGTAHPGPVKLWPPQVEIATSIGDPDVERVTWLKAVRSGYTFLVASAIARHVLDDPCHAIVLMPTEADVRGIVVDDIEPLFDASPNLKGLLPEPARDERGRSTLLQRFYPGGSLKALPARSALNLRRHTAKAVFADETDVMECAEGDPLLLAARRTLTYANRKLVCGSSPSTEDTSLIAELYADSDQRVFEIACPRCDHRFELWWQHIECPEGS